ncbi:HNH endonuclease [Pseudarthrobacter sp. alpha12b]
MDAVILGCDTNLLRRWNYRAAVAQVAASGTFLDRWRVRFHPGVGPGTEAWFLLEGGNDAASGLVGHGFVTSEPYQAAADADADGTDWFFAVALDSLLPLGEQIRPGILCEALPGDLWDKASFPSLVTVPPSSVPVLRRLWRDHGPSTADPAEVAGGTFPPEDVSTIQVNRYERDPDARRACLAFHGTSCAACGFSFESAYGVAGTGVMGVHHLVPPAVLDGKYQLDPIADLIPLCHNCHAMAHNVSPPLTVTELRSIISATGHVRGEVVTEVALQAQEDARRILGGGQM